MVRRLPHPYRRVRPASGSAAPTCAAACAGSRWTPCVSPRSATKAATAMTMHIPKSTSWVAVAKSALMNWGMAAVLPLPP